MSTNTFINSIPATQGVSSSLPVSAYEELRDIKGFFAIELPLWLQITLLVMVLGYLAYIIYVKYIKKKPEADLTVYQLTVKQLKDLDVAKNSKDFYLSYSECIRTFLERRLGMHALDKTADEMRQVLVQEPRIQTSQALSLTKIFQRADLAKFALYTVPIETKARDIETTLEIVKYIEDAVIAEENALKVGSSTLNEEGEVTI